VRIARFTKDGGLSFGVVEDDDTIATVAAHPFGEIQFTGERQPLADVRLTAPILPNKVIAIGRNYAEHARELGNEVPDEPLVFMKPSTTVIGQHEAIVYPSLSEQVDYEGELAVVIGRLARHVRAEEAGRYVLGFTCGNDVTARDLQRKDGQWTRGKGFDGFCPLGPWIETQLSPLDLEVECRVNGEVRQNARTSTLAFGPNELVEFVSRVMTLLPGDVIMTGTPAGVGPLSPGDLCEVEIEGIGTLANPVVQGD
jgi:2-keto-4-pentenoate hydratase/2-oxohepta-3-ene-1,7-dioic acid hydratase in catechol pathway